MQKAHPILSLAQRSALRQASRAGRFAKRWQAPVAAAAPQRHRGIQAQGRDRKKDQLSKAGGGKAPLLKYNPMY